MAPERVLLRRMRRAYELGRLKRAACSVWPLVGVSTVSLLLGSVRILDVVLAGALVVIGFGFVWQGQVAEKAVVPGVAAGLAPFVLAWLANGPREGCEHGSLYSYCVLACAVGGVVAQVVVVRFARNHQKQVTAWGLATVLAFVVGGMGCGCIGYSGILTLAGAMLLTSAPDLARWAWRAA